MGRVPKVTEIDEPNQNTYYGYHFGQHVAKVVELTLQRRFVAYLLGYRVVNVTNCSFPACERDDSACSSIYDSGSLRKGEGRVDDENRNISVRKIACSTCLV